MNAGHRDEQARSKELLIEAALGAHRERTATGRIQPSPAWMDLTADERIELHKQQTASRIVERALDPAGLSSTARAVMARLAFV